MHHYLIPILLALSFFCGCTRQSTQPEKARLRLVSTAPNITEFICAIGASDLLVGRTESCDFPSEIINRVPVTGGFGTPWLEPLLTVHPTHVLETILADPEIICRLKTLNIPVIHVTATRLDQIPSALRQLGTLTSCDTQANTLATIIQTGLDTARSATTNCATKPRVLLLFAPDTPITAGRHAFISELLELAGAINLGNAIQTDYYHISLEWILTQNPDIILCVFDTLGRDPYSFFTDQLGWKALRAIRNRRVYAIPNLSAVSRPGPRVLEGLAQFKQILTQDTQRQQSKVFKE